MAFSRIKTSSTAEHALDQIIGALTSGEYSVGDKLPPERNLAEMLGISRNTLREAIQILAFLNIVQMQHGIGTIILSTTVDEALAFKVAEVLTTKENYIHALETRILMEPGIAALAAERAEESDLETMKGTLSEIEELTTKKLPWGGAAMRFHVAIARAAKNPVVEHVIITPLAIWYNDDPEWLALISKKLLTEPKLLKAYDHCLEIFQAIKNRDAAGAGEAMKKRMTHLQQMFYGST